ncbi:putative surface protein, possible component of pili like system [Halanaeroarchaeum sp. HSR-CO]|uniref:hypothetical protein n=1 Tax=Halanaeroarchaeum sp. HSR-CO TaxID=2866382 RepID=UPI00217D2FCE|nr:hypothetical protein [Halanaeroarchaeum sp. HSR-CO]UWG48570.1 putative surface protein, possible component of pili like system [Halanaeroarchaeum sp. HSR-CO]
MVFRDDDRAQSVQVGAVLLFAVLVILLAGYQSTVVPNDNRAAEFDHSLEAEEDMLDVRNAIIEAYQDGEASPVSVRLGMTYPRHTFGIDPAPVGGTLRTGESGTIAVSEPGEGALDVCPSSDQTKPLTYAADYNYYQPTPTLIYDNTVLYADYEPGREVLISEQSLIRGDTVNLVALQGNYSTNGIGSTDYNPRAGQLRETTGVENPTVTVPTQLSQERWRELLADQVDDPAADVTVSDGVLTVSLDGEYDVRCSAIGSNEAPPGGDRSAEGEGDEINPVGAEEVLLLDSTVEGNTNADVRFENEGEEPVSIVGARLNFYLQSNTGKSTPTSATLYDDPAGANTELTTVQVKGPRENFDSTVELTPGSPETIRFDFDFDDGGNPQMENDFFVVKIYFDDGTSNLYFVTPE